MLELLSRGLVEEGGDCAAFRLASDQASYLPVDLETQAQPRDTEKVRCAITLGKACGLRSSSRGAALRRVL